MKLKVNEAKAALETMRAVLKGDFEDFLKEVESMIGLCRDCYGRGFILRGMPEGGGYRLHRTKDARVVYEYPCGTCLSGRQGGVQPCSGCGQNTEVDAFAKFLNATGIHTKGYPLCDNCDASWENRFGYVQEAPTAPPPAPEEEEKIKKAHEEADKDKHEPEKEHPKRKRK